MVTLTQERYQTNNQKTTLCATLISNSNPRTSPPIRKEPASPVGVKKTQTHNLSDNVANQFTNEKGESDSKFECSTFSLKTRKEKEDRRTNVTSELKLRNAISG